MRTDFSSPMSKLNKEVDAIKMGVLEYIKVITLASPEERIGMGIRDENALLFIIKAQLRNMDIRINALYEDFNNGKYSQHV